MRKLLLFLVMLFSMNLSHAYTGVYVGWQNFISPIIPTDVQANTLAVGIMGTTPTRFYFYHNILGNIVFTSGKQGIGQLGWGLDVAGGIGYRFLNTAHKRAGWDIGLDFFAYFNPYFLNSETGFTETAIYYGIGLGLSTLYKFNPYIGLGVRATFKYNIGTKHIGSEAPSTGGLLFSVGTFLSF